MRNIIIIILGLLFIFLNINPSQASSNNYILATVNGINIFSYDIEKRLKILGLLDPSIKQDNSTLKTNLLNQLIEENLIIEDSKNYNFGITKEDVVAQINYVESLNKWPQGSIYERAKKFNLTKTDVSDYFFKQTLIQKFIQNFGFSKAGVTNAEVDKEYYSLLGLNGKMQYLISEIFISTSNKSKEAAKEQIDHIYNNLRKGVNFNLMVSSYSENIYSKNNKGLVGWIYETQIPLLEKNALDSIKKNGFTAPLFINNGYYIFKLLDKKPIIYINPNDTNSTNQLKTLLKEKLTSEKAREVISNYINNLKNHAIITYYNK